MLNCFRGQIRSETNTAENLFITYQWETSCKNLSPARNVCEAAPRSLFWASNRFNELTEARFELRLQPDYGRSTMAFFYRPTMARTEIFVHSWLACSRRSDRGDSEKRCEQKKRGGGVGVRGSLSHFSSLFFSHLSSFTPHSAIRTGTG